MLLCARCVCLCAAVWFVCEVCCIEIILVQMKRRSYPPQRRKPTSTESARRNIPSPSLNTHPPKNGVAPNKGKGTNPGGWRYSEEKQRIINCLKDPLSEIHLMSKEQIWKKYAANFDENKTKTNLSYLLKQHKKKEGPFSPSQSPPSKSARARSSSKKDTETEPETEPEIEPWTSRKKKSQGWHLLYQLRLFPQQSRVSRMTQKELWESSELFKCYDFKDFQKYDKEMVKLTRKRRETIRQERKEFEHDMAAFPPSERTVRGEPFWNRHAASKLLKEDVESGAADNMKPGELWKTRPEYKEFKLTTFSKHVHQEKSKQRAAPYWQVKCKKIGRQLRDQQVEESKREWIESKFETDMEDLINQWNGLKAS